MHHKWNRRISSSLWKAGLGAIALVVPAAAPQSGTTSQTQGAPPATLTKSKPASTAPATQDQKSTPKAAQASPGKSQSNSTSAHPQTVTVESLDALQPHFCADDNPKLNAWVQLQECKPGGARVVAWPLFSINASQVATPVPVDKCLSADIRSCGLDEPKKAWLIGPVHTGENIQPHVTNIEVGRGLPSSKAYSSFEDEQAAILQILENKLRLVELSWRMGAPYSANEPVFTLNEGATGKTISRKIGTCESVTVAEVTVGDNGPWMLQSDCSLPGNSTPDEAPSPNTLLSTIAFDSSQPFRWTMQSQTGPVDLSTIKIQGNESVHLKLFPYTMNPFADANGSDGQAVPGRQSVPILTGLMSTSESSSYLLTLNIPLIATTGGNADSDEAKEARARQSQWTWKWPFLIGIPAAVIAGFVLLFWKRKQVWAFLAKGRKARSAAEQPRASPETKAPNEPPAIVPAAIPPLEVVETRTKTSEKASAHDDEIVNRVMKRAETKMRTLINEAMEGENDRRVKGAAQREEQIVARVMRSAKPLVQNTVKEELESQFLGLGGATLPQLRTELTTAVQTIDTRIERMLKDSAMQWAQSLLEELPESTAATVKPRENLQLPPVNAQAREVLEAMRDLSQLAMELLALWSQLQQNSASDWQKTGLGQQILSDLRVLESIVFVDWLLWMWLCGDLTPTHLTEGLLRFGMSKWHVPASGDLDAAALAKDWAQFSVPVLQNLIEGGPNYFHCSDPSGVRRAVVELGERHTSMRNAPALLGAAELPDDLYLNAASETLHGLVSALYGLIGVQYFRMRLFRDTMDLRDIPQVLDQTRAAWTYSLSRDLVANGIENRHGLIVRMGKPHTKSGSSGWGGALYYLQEAPRA